MHIQLTQAAQDALILHQAGSDTPVKLLFDSEGCGCAVNGIPRLQAVSSKQTDDLIVSDEPVELLIEQQNAIYFEEQMKLDYSAAKRLFKLSSNEQIYNASMTFTALHKQGDGPNV